MNAFVQIISQIIDAVPPSVWLEQNFFSFVNIPYPKAHLYDSLIFRQQSSGALGIIWIKFNNYEEICTLPMRLVRYNDDSELYGLSPWSLRDASADYEFYEALHAYMGLKNTVFTNNGAQFVKKYLYGNPGVRAVCLENNRRNTFVRVESEEIYKISHVLSVHEFDSLEIEILTYLNQQTTFQFFPKIINVYNYQSREIPKANVAMSLRYIRNDGNLWKEFTSRIQHARYPSKKKMRAAKDSWDYVIRCSEQIGRILGEFHRAMLYARENPNLVPEPRTNESFKTWLDFMEQVMYERLSMVAKVSCDFPFYQGFMLYLADFGKALFNRLSNCNPPCVRIRVHGRVHLGEIIVDRENLYLTDYANDHMDSREFRKFKHPCLTDVAAMLLSIKYAWYTTENMSYSPVFEEFIDKDSELGKQILQSQTDITIPSGYKVSLTEIENTYINSYLSTIYEDPNASELIPSENDIFQILSDFLFFMRTLKEFIRDYNAGNPRSKIVLKIIQDFVSSKNFLENSI